MKPPSDAQLRVLEQRIAELEAKNAHLRHSAQLFGDLAERLNERLRRAAEMPEPGEDIRISQP